MSNTKMTDRDIMNNILLLEKGVCDLYMHGTIESSTDNVHKTFACALKNSLAAQDSIYKKMSAKGWFKTDSAEGTRIDSVRQKFSACACGA